MKEHNVIGTMQLLAAAQKTPRLRKLVMKSTTAVYGSNYADPALFREDVPPGDARRAGYSKDAVEIESYGRAFGRRRSDVTVTILRFANLVGPRVSTPLTRYLSLPVVPTVLGYDPRLQLCHEHDAVEVLVRSTLEEHPGIYNVAGPGILYLSQAIRRAGKPSVQVALPFVNGVAQLVRRTGRIDFSPEQLQFLLYGRVGDISRLRELFGHEPKFSTRAAFDDFISSRGVAGPLGPGLVAQWEQRLYDVLTPTPPDHDVWN
jgi:UDP-glucose 4-epimerase